MSDDPIVTIVEGSGGGAMVKVAGRITDRLYYMDIAQEQDERVWVCNDGVVRNARHQANADAGEFVAVMGETILDGAVVRVEMERGQPPRVVPGMGRFGEEMDRAALAQLPFAEALKWERTKQRDTWGDGHDDEHTMPEWQMLMAKYGAKLQIVFANAVLGDGPISDIRVSAVKLGALCQALVEAIDRDGRGKWNNGV